MEFAIIALDAMKKMNAFVGASLISALVLMVPAFLNAAPPVLRLSGGFIQFQDEMKTWKPAVWTQVLDRMKDLKMDTVILQMMAIERSDGTTNSFIGPVGQNDPTSAILNYADANGFKVYLGLYIHRLNGSLSMTQQSFLTKAMADNVFVAQQAWQRYMQPQRHPSFAGWYIPLETWTGDYQTAEIDRLRAFFRGVHDGCCALSGEVPVAISPFINADRTSPYRTRQVYQALLRESGIDIVLLQDSVGAQVWSTGIRERSAPYFEAMQTACQTNGVRLWANLESFQLSESAFIPCEPGRFKTQFDSAAPYVESFITFDFFHYMNGAVFLSYWNTAYRMAMQRLHDEYRKVFVEKDYRPLASPEVYINLQDGKAVINWEAGAGEQFEVQNKTSLDALAWSDMGSITNTNSTGFMAANIDSIQQPQQYFRLRKIPPMPVSDSMVWISPGTFQMGTPESDANRTIFELPQFQITMTNGFFISRCEVTQWQYQNIMSHNPCLWRGSLDQPVENVSWYDARSFCAKFTDQERRNGRISNGFYYRLPTEAEWEYAARAGTTSLYGFGNDSTLLEQHGWYVANADVPSPVGLLSTNSWGLSDVHGNVYEWCWDWIGQAPSGPVTNYMGATNGAYHGLRGGSWKSPATECRSSWRKGYGPSYRDMTVGFRMVLVPN